MMWILRSAATAPSAKTAPPPAAEQLELQGDTWRVCNFVDKKDIVKLSEATMRQKVQVGISLIRDPRLAMLPGPHFFSK